MGTQTTRTLGPEVSVAQTVGDCKEQEGEGMRLKYFNLAAGLLLLVGCGTTNELPHLSAITGTNTTIMLVPEPTDYAITKAKAKYRKANPACALCGLKRNITNGNKNPVHHITPVHVNRMLAAVQTNLITLCRGCHFTKAHLSNYKHYNANLAETIKQLKLTLDKYAVRKGE